MLSHRAGDGDNKARSPGRARRKPLKPFAQGMPGRSGEPVVTMLVCFIYFAREAAGALAHPAFPAPSVIEGILCITRTYCAAGTRRCVTASISRKNARSRRMGPRLRGDDDRGSACYAL